MTSTGSAAVWRMKKNAVRWRRRGKTTAPVASIGWLLLSSSVSIRSTANSVSVKVVVVIQIGHCQKEKKSMRAVDCLSVQIVCRCKKSNGLFKKIMRRRRVSPLVESHQPIIPRYLVLYERAGASEASFVFSSMFGAIFSQHNFLNYL